MWREQHEMLFLPIEHRKTYLRINVYCSFCCTDRRSDDGVFDDFLEHCRKIYF